MSGRIPRPTSLLAGALPAIPAPALAADPGAVASLGGEAVRAAAALGLVLGLIALLAWLVRRFREGTPGRPRTGRLVAVDRLDLGSRREIRLVRVAGRQLVVGVASDRMTLLADLPDDGQTARIESGPKVAVLEALQKLATS